MALYTVSSFWPAASPGEVVTSLNSAVPSATTKRQKSWEVTYELQADRAEVPGFGPAVRHRDSGDSIAVVIGDVGGLRTPSPF